MNFRDIRSFVTAILMELNRLLTICIEHIYSLPYAHSTQWCSSSPVLNPKRQRTPCMKWSSGRIPAFLTSLLSYLSQGLESFFKTLKTFFAGDIFPSLWISRCISPIPRVLNLTSIETTLKIQRRIQPRFMKIFSVECLFINRW